MNVKFDFSLGDKVLLKEIQRPGRIDCIQLDAYGPMYRVCYWDNSDRKTAWLYAEEVELRVK